MNQRSPRRRCRRQHSLGQGGANAANWQCCLSWGLVALLFVGALTGCRPLAREPLELSQASFEFKLDGQPLSDAQIIFLPKLSEDSQGRYLPWSYGITDQNGRLELRTSERSLGVVPGTHWVIVSRQANRVPEKVDVAGDPLAVLDETVWDSIQIANTLESEQVPKQFNWPTRLQIEVPAGQTNQVPVSIELTSELSTGFAPK